MARRRAILIGCPQYRRSVRGTYECDDAGSYLLGPEGEFLLDRVACDQLGGRCMETLCVLHRFNRRGPGAWYPDRIYAAPDARRPGPPSAPADAAGPPPDTTIWLRA